ncbi:MAG: hypothetical protein INR73_19315 [Williamsia sp.]|nr:hypothetical protein [Williamsia sp.]
MNDSLEYIEAYFERELDEAGRQQFEKRCEQDVEFARDVALYITTREAMKLSLAEQKREEWRLLGNESRSNLEAVSGNTADDAALQEEERLEAVPQAPVRKLAIRRWIPYAVAASVLLFVAIYFTDSDRELRKQIASNKQEELMPISPTMGAQDSLEQAKEAYNNQEDEKALRLFRGILQADSTHDQALLYMGHTFWRQKNYDSALHYLDKLSALELSSNKGPYNKALVLLERNQLGDRDTAKKLLQNVVAEKQEGYRRAQGLLDLMK